MIKPTTFLITPTMGRDYRPGEVIGIPFVIELSKVATANNLCDVLTDLMVIDPGCTHSLLNIYLFDAPMPFEDGELLWMDGAHYLGRVQVGEDWYEVGDTSVEEQCRLRLLLASKDKVYGYTTRAGIGADFSGLRFTRTLTVKVGVHQA